MRLALPSYSRLSRELNANANKHRGSSHYHAGHFVPGETRCFASTKDSFATIFALRDSPKTGTLLHKNKSSKVARNCRANVDGRTSVNAKVPFNQDRREEDGANLINTGVPPLSIPTVFFTDEVSYQHSSSTQLPPCFALAPAIDKALDAPVVNTVERSVAFNLALPQFWCLG